MPVVKKKCNCGREYDVHMTQARSAKKSGFYFLEGSYSCKPCGATVRCLDYIEITGSGGTAEQIAKTTGATIPSPKKEVQ